VNLHVERTFLGASRQILDLLGELQMNGMLEMEANVARGDDIEVAKVPASVRKAVDKAVPGAKWESAYSEMIYELEGRDGKGRAVVVEVTDEGEVNDVSTEIPIKEVPEAVVAAFKAKMPRFKVTTVYESRQKGKVVGYSVEGRRPKDKDDVGLFVSPDGKTVEIDDDE
jgi:hypothetical protein